MREKRTKPAAGLFFLVYLARIALLVYLLGPRALRAVLGMFRGLTDEQYIERLACLDLPHDVFLALIPAGLFILLWPADRPRLSSARSRLLFAAALGLAAAFLPVLAAWRARTPLVLVPLFFGGVAYVGFNVFVFACRRLATPDSAARLDRLARRGLLLADVASPPLVWSAYAQIGGLALAPLRLIAACLVCLPAVIGAAASPQPLDGSSSRWDRDISRLIAGNTNEVVSVADDALVAAYHLTALRLVDSRDGRVRAGHEFTALDAIGFHYEPATDLVTALSAHDEEIYLLQVRGRDLSVAAERVQIQHAYPLGGSTVTLWDPARGIRIGVSENGFFRLDPISGDVTHLVPGTRVMHAALDPRRRAFYVSIWEPPLVAAYDADTLEPLAWLNVPSFPSRLAVDPTTDRLFAAFSFEGVVRVIDPATMKEVDRIDAWPGVRTVAVDAPGRLLFLAGFLPTLEIRSLDDYHVLRRLVGPPWVRPIALAPDRSAAYIGTIDGLYRLDLAHALSRRVAGWCNRLDPFYLLLRAAGPAARLLGGFDLARGPENLPPPTPVPLSPAAKQNP